MMSSKLEESKAMLKAKMTTMASPRPI